MGFPTLQAGFSEFFSAACNRTGYPLVVDGVDGGGNPLDTRRERVLEAVNHDQFWGVKIGNDDSKEAAILLSQWTVGTRIFGRGASAKEHVNGTEEMIPGPRCMGFYLMTGASDVRVVFDVYLKDQYGEILAERVSLSGRTHSLAPAFTTWLAAHNGNGWSPTVDPEFDPVDPTNTFIGAEPVASEFYNPQGLDLLPTPRKAWAWRIPVADAWRTKHAISQFLWLELVSKSGTIGASDVLVPHWKTLSFGVRAKLDSLDDVIGGMVLGQPSLRLGSFHGLSVPTAHYLLQAALGGPAAGWAPMIGLESGIKKRYMKIEPNNVLSFTKTSSGSAVEGPNPHVYGNAARTGLAFSIDQRGEMALGIQDQWSLVLSLRDRVSV